MSQNQKLWGGRFSVAEEKLMEEFNASIGVDQALFEEDITGSIAQARMLAKQKLITATESQKIIKGLEKIRAEIRAGQFEFDIALEDIHMAVETRLHKLIGDTAGKLHTGRSRNDQVATDEKLWLKKAVRHAVQYIRALQKAFVEQAAKNTNTILPGYTHLQRAQPIVLAHHLLAYFEMLERDVSRFEDLLTRCDWSPLGSGALAGSPLPLDRHMTAAELGFRGPTRNSLDSVADRDHLLDFLQACSVLMMHLSRLSEELILWSSQEFGFVRLPEGFCTGSSMMPQKINPDAPELVRGKVGRVYGNLISLFTVMKGLPLSYNKDMQEDKEPVFDSFHTISICLKVMTRVIAGSVFETEKMRAATKLGFVNATDLADALVKKGVPFRKAHEFAGRSVRLATERGCGLEDLSLQDYQKITPDFDATVFEALKMEQVVSARSTFGGTSPQVVRKQVAFAQKILQKTSKIPVKRGTK